MVNVFQNLNGDMKITRAHKTQNDSIFIIKLLKFKYYNIVKMLDDIGFRFIQVQICIKTKNLAITLSSSTLRLNVLHISLAISALAHPLFRKAAS